MPAAEDSDGDDQSTGGTAAPAQTGGAGGGGTGGSSAPAAGGSSGAGGSGGSGGATAAGGSGGSGGAAGAMMTAGTGPSGSDSAVDVGNFFKSGDWQGYVWTSVSGDGSTITPMTFEGVTTGMPRCVSGSVGPMPDFSGTAILGFNLNEGAGATGMPVAPTKAGVNIRVTNKAGSVLRLQVQTASTGGTQWCSAIVGAGGFLTWDALRTACWGSTGMKYMREPIVSAMVLVPGKDTMPVAFDFCVEELAEADGPSGGGGTGGAGAGAGGAVAAGSGGAGGAGAGGAGGAGGSGGGGAGGAGGGGTGGTGGAGAGG